MTNRADSRKFHYIYKITRTDGSGKFYIGLHSTDNLDDGYFGSGQLLWRSIKKHGKEKHSKEILEFLPDRVSLRKRERELVNEDLLGDELCMNLCLGGDGGFDTLNIKKQNLYGKNGKLGFGGENLRTPENNTKASKTRWQLHRKTYLAVITRAQPLATRAATSKEAMVKRKASYEKAAHQQGEKNSQFGTCWIHKDERALKIKKDLLQEYLNRGFVRGRKNNSCFSTSGSAQSS